MTAHSDPFASAEHNARVWLAAVAEGLGTEDRHRAYRVLRAWLHLVRDQLSVNGVVHLGAQLPEIVRGIYYEDWVPDRPPVRCTESEYVDEFAGAAQLRHDDAASALTAVTSVLRDRFSPGQLDHALVQLRRPLRSALRGEPTLTTAHEPGNATRSALPSSAVSTR